MHACISLTTQNTKKKSHVCVAQIKAVNKAYLRHIAGVNHAEDLMIQAGWRSKVQWGPDMQLCTSR
jgi:hypothetical protein